MEIIGKKNIRDCLPWNRNYDKALGIVPPTGRILTLST
jgi:hypothetical protein